MAQQTAAGSGFEIGTTLAADNQAGFEADTFAEMGEITNIGDFGKEYQIIETKALKQRRVRKIKGSYDNGTLELELYLDPDDAGQTAALAALDTDDNYNFKITLNDAPTAGAAPTPTTYYFRGLVTTFRTSVSDVDSAVTARCVVAINSEILKVPAATGD
ncbi:hypothetical protein [Nisaea nitritireducens]|uniref:hypothetical protein n=1 Tax=Nisaea nitritireducens TaxID=568392 RepID=UPI001868FACD|nr:hypothetical protein [Nisaea nitritireducens]